MIFILPILKTALEFVNEKELNKYTSDYNEETIYGVKDVNYIIVEGLYAGYLKKFKMANYVIHLEGNPEQTLKFRKKRNKENENSEFRKQVVQREYNIVSQLKRYADKIIEV